jgi:hypothetical protein
LNSQVVNAEKTYLIAIFVKTILVKKWGYLIVDHEPLFDPLADVDNGLGGCRVAEPHADLASTLWNSFSASLTQITFFVLV